MVSKNNNDIRSGPKSMALLMFLHNDLKRGKKKRVTLM